MDVTRAYADTRMRSPAIGVRIGPFPACRGDRRRQMRRQDIHTIPAPGTTAKSGIAFRLVPGGWIALDPDSGSTLQADHDGLAIGLLLPETGASRKSTASDYGLYPGNGRMTRDELRLTLRLWRDCAAQQDDRAFRPL